MKTPPADWRRWRDIVLDEDSTAAQTRSALAKLATVFSDIGGIEPDRSFDGWREDTWLAQGLAINPGAAAFCLTDYQRSTILLRGVHAALTALQRERGAQSIDILYAGCGPFALQLLPLLDLFVPAQLNITLLDIHQASLDSVDKLRRVLAPEYGHIRCIKADASCYQHPTKLNLIIVETMQKSLEQEPQFAVTANLGPQLADAGVFIPERIEVELCLANLDREQALLADDQVNTKAGEGNSNRSSGRYAGAQDCQRVSLGNVIRLEAHSAAQQLASARHQPLSSMAEIELGLVTIPDIATMSSLTAALFTRIKVYDDFWLKEYESQITLPSKPSELSPLRPASVFRASYQLGAYPRLTFREAPPDSIIGSGEQTFNLL